MKNLLLIVVGVVVGYLCGKHSSISAEVTYSEQGKKTVVSICDKDMDCKIRIGQECDDNGYKIIKTDHDDMKSIMTAECGEPKKTSLF